MISEKDALLEIGVVKLDEPFVNPMSSIVTAPDFAAHEPSRDGSARNQHRPEVPDIRPGRLRPGTPPIRNQAFARLHNDFQIMNMCQAEYKSRPPANRLT